MIDTLSPESDADAPRCCTTTAAVQLCRCDTCGTFFRCLAGTERDCGAHGRPR